jgi:hypothetical protein
MVFLIGYISICYLLYFGFVSVNWCSSERREGGFIQYWVDSYISEKLLLTLTLGILIFPPFVCTYVFVKWLVTSVKGLCKYINKVYRSDDKWFV